MSHTASLRRSATVVGATALLGMVLAAPALASPDSGQSVAADSTTATSQFPHGLDRSMREGTTTTGQFPHGLDRSVREGTTTAIDRERQLGGFTYSKELSTLPQETTEPAAPPTVVRVEDDTIEYLQVGAGVLAGILLAGVGGVVISRRHDSGLKPA